MRLTASSDTRILVVGAAAFVALVAYLGVAFANTHPQSSPAFVNTLAPWTPYGSTLVSIPRKEARGFDVQVIPAEQGLAKLGSYGALAPTLVPQPSPGARFAVGVWLREQRPGPIGVQIHVFRSGASSKYLVDTTVRATPKWHHFTFRGRVRGSWGGISMYVYRLANLPARPRFTIRHVTVKLH